MAQLALFEEKIPLKAPNVASVPQYSPFRYPGGKTWLYPFAKQWLLAQRKNRLIELFAGGASIGLTAGIEGLVNQVVLVEKDYDIYAFWKTVFSEDDRWLANKLIKFDLNEKNLEYAFENKENSLRDRAFATLLANRTNHGGIMANGSGRIKHGENGKGISSRWYPKTLYNRILQISHHKAKFTIIHGDALEYLENNLSSEDLFFIDPPYTKAGKRLYTHFSIDHSKLFSLCNLCESDFLLTYDEADEIKELASKYNFRIEKILMQTTHLLKKYELLISRNLFWL